MDEKDFKKLVDAVQALRVVKRHLPMNILPGFDNVLSEAEKVILKNEMCPEWFKAFR